MILPGSPKCFEAPHSYALRENAVNTVIGFSASMLAVDLSWKVEDGTSDSDGRVCCEDFGEVRY